MSNRQQHPMDRDPSTSLAAKRDEARKANALKTRDDLVLPTFKSYDEREKENVDRIREAKRAQARDLLSRRLGYVPSRAQLDSFLGLPNDGNTD